MTLHVCKSFPLPLMIFQGSCTALNLPIDCQIDLITNHEYLYPFIKVSTLGFHVPFCSEFFFFKLLLGGALKPTDVETLWVHVTCAWFQPEVSFASDEKMEPALGILSIPSNSFVKVEYSFFSALFCNF